MTDLVGTELQDHQSAGRGRCTRAERGRDRRECRGFQSAVRWISTETSEGSAETNEEGGGIEGEGRGEEQEDGVRFAHSS